MLRLILFLILSFNFLICQVIYVSTTGSDDNGDGSENNPYATIQTAVNNVSNSDTIFIKSGLYTENINWSMASNVRLIGVHMDSTIIDGGGLDIVIDNSDDTSHPSEISNLTIQNGITTGKGGGISLKMIGELLLKNIKVDNNYAVKGGGVYIEGEGSLSLLSTVVYIENSIISNNTADTNGGGIALSGDLISSIMKNVTVVNNSALNGGGIISGSAGNYVIIANSIFWNNQPTNADGMIFPYYSNIDIPIGINNTFIDPLFIDDDNDFHLSIGSPCIDSGTELLVVDLSGEMLPGLPPDTVLNLDTMSYFGVKPDMGAYESNYIGLTEEIEGRWIIPVAENDPGNTMYEFLDGLRYTYYCADENGCDSTYWNSLDTSDAIPNPNPYTFYNDTLTINLFFGNTWQQSVTFECDGNIVFFGDTTSLYWWRVGLDTSECEEFQLTSPITAYNPNTFRLNQNYPNPFNPTTNLSYELSADSYVTISVYDLLGNMVKNLVSEYQNSGFKSIQWNATNNQGQPVSAGVYLYSIEAGDYRQTKKMILLK